MTDNADWLNEERLQALVARVTKQVVSEVSKGEAKQGLSVSEFREQASLLGEANLVPWSISYKTKSDNFEEESAVAAWEISYKTKSDPE